MAKNDQGNERDIHTIWGRIAEWVFLGLWADSPLANLKIELLTNRMFTVCIGMHLARIELRLATALFFRRFPEARVSEKEGMRDEDMLMKCFFLMAPKGHRCLIEA